MVQLNGRRVDLGFDGSLLLAFVAEN